MRDFKNLDAEKVLINQMLLEPSIIPNVYDVVKPETFFSLSYRRCYEHLLELNRKCTPIDLVSFHTECKDINYQVFEEVTNATFTSANWHYYADLVKKCYTSRSIELIMNQKASELNDSNGVDVVNSLIQEASQISVNTTSCETYDIAELAKEYIQILTDRIREKKELTGYSTGLKNLDEVTLGLQKEYIVIGARPSLGKTALGQQIALHCAGLFGGEPHKTLFVELEMSAKQLTERAVANMTHIPINRLRSGILSEMQLKKIMNKVQSFSNSQNFVPVTCNTRKLGDIVACVRREVRNNGCEIAFIDHIGLIHPEGHYSSSWEGYREISNTLQQLQRELNIPIIVMSQVGRATEGKNPSLADLRGSGAIEEDADTVMFIERERQKDINEDRIPTKINIVKNRNGACGSASLIFMPKEVMFVDDNGQYDDTGKNGCPDMSKSYQTYQSNEDTAWLEQQ